MKFFFTTFLFAIATLVEGKGLLFQDLAKNIIEFNNTFLANGREDAAVSNHEFLELFTLSCRVQNRYTYTRLLEVLPNSFFISDLSLKFVENVTMFFSSEKHPQDVLMVYMDFMIQYTKKVCNLRDYFHEDFFISATFNYDLCFRLHGTQMIHEHLKKMYLQFHASPFPYVFMHHVADYQLYFRALKNVIALYPKYYFGLEPFEKFFLQIFY